MTVDLPKVTPSVGVRGRDASKENVGVFNSAEVAIGRIVRVGHLATSDSFPGFDVLTAGLALTWVEVNQLVLGALYLTVGETDRQHTGHHVRERRETVHENPEAREVGRLSKNTTEDEAEREHQVGQVTTSLGGINTSNDHVREG